MSQPAGRTPDARPVARRAWPLFRSLAGWRSRDLGADAVAGLTLAAIAIPSQIATARLAGLAPEIGFLALLAGAIGFAIFGDSRRVFVGADSTIAPIFAGSLAALQTAGGEHYAVAAAALALAVGIILVLGGALRLGFIADLLSIPVTTGFLVGIAGHILISQAPQVLGLDQTPGPLLARAYSLMSRIGSADGWTLGIGAGMLGLMMVTERVSPRFPAALIGLLIAASATVAFGLEARGVTTLGALTGLSAHLALPAGISFEEFRALAPLSVIISMVIMVQTAATTRAFSDREEGPDVNRDFIGLGVANAIAGLIGAFPVDASPPSTAVVAEAGGVSQLAGLICAALALCVVFVGGQAFAHVPNAALAGVLLFIAMRIVRVGVIVDVWRRSLPEFLLIAATATAILALPIQEGVTVGIVMSLLHGVWTTTRARAIELQRIPGTSIWWPPGRDIEGEVAPGVKVVALQAPLSFLNAYDFRSAIEGFASEGGSVRLIVIEANALAEIDYTGASVLADLVRRLRGRGVDVAIARLESLRAQESLARKGLLALLGQDHIFHSVQEAVEALSGQKRRETQD